MNLSRFFGSTNREALRQVRLALGPDALIVSNRRVNGGVEIMAADETSLSVQPADPDANVMDAIGAMRGALEVRMDEVLWGSQLRSTPGAIDLFQTLLAYGFSTALLRAMLKRLPAHLSSKAAFQWARNELITHLPAVQNEDDLWTPGTALALVGPTGVGKTTTIAKLAARCVQRFGARNVVLLTTDTYRIGAYEQLQIYGRMMQLAVHSVQDADELRQVMQGLASDQTVLIDNVGISQRDHYITEQALILANARRPVSRILVLNASSSGDTLDEVARAYSGDGGSPLAGCIITKLDEATRLAAALDTAIRYQLPINYVSDGQKVPENLLFLSASALVDQALACQRQAQTLYAPTSADFAVLMSLVRAPDSDSTIADNGRKRLLPGLLSAVGSADFMPSTDDLKDACVFLDDDFACSEAFDLWRDYSVPGQAGRAAVSIEADIRHAVGNARNHLARMDHRYVMAVHDSVSVKLRSGDRGRLRASVLLTQRAAALTTPMQQLEFADGWRSSCGATALTAPSRNDAVRHQIQWLNQCCPQLPLVHVFDKASAALWHKLCAQNVSWLSQCAGATKIKLDSCLTTLAAVSKTLVYRPLEQLGRNLQLTEFRNKPIGDTMFWVGCANVELPARKNASLVLQLISLRIIDRRDGALIKTIYGLSNLLPAQVEPDVLAAWLIAGLDIKTGFQCSASAWKMLAEREQPGSSQKRALIAVQLGLAAWQVKQSADARQARTILRGLAGESRLSAHTAASVMLKLFALKEMLA